MEKFKASDEFLNKLYEYYVDGFELICKYLAKHHPTLDFSQLDMEEVEKEILEDHPSDAATEDEVMSGLTRRIPIDEIVPDVTESVPTNPSPSNLPWKKILLPFCFVRKNIVIFGAHCFEHVYLFPLNNLLNNLLGSSVWVYNLFQIVPMLCMNDNTARN